MSVSEQLIQYAIKVGLTPVAPDDIPVNLPYEKVKAIFDLAVKDYVEGKIDDREISDIAANIYFTHSNPANPHEVDEKDPLLGNLLSFVAELTYYGMKPSRERLYMGVKRDIKNYYASIEQNEKK